MYWEQEYNAIPNEQVDPYMESATFDNSSSIGCWKFLCYYNEEVKTWIDNHTSSELNNNS